MHMRAAAAPIDTAEAFLAGLAEDVRPPVADGRRVAAVVAHPDDETIGCGATLARLDGVHLAVITDGAPRDHRDARAKGFAGAHAYAAARSRELEAAAAAALVAPDRLLRMGIADQRVMHEVVDLVRGLAAYLESRRVRVVLTHAFEGGHPDHDGAAFAVHAAATVLARQGVPVGIVEMPFYRLGSPEETLRQSFVPLPGATATVVGLDARERWVKRRMARCHRTQAETLAPFDLATERYRSAPRYRFDAPPNDGRILYERQAWGVHDFAEWRALAARALAPLGLDFGGIACRPC